MLLSFLAWYAVDVADSDVPPLNKDEVYVVWYNYTLGHSKALISTTRKDHKYYELTYNSRTNQLYVDSYLKVRHDELDDIMVEKTYKF